MRRQLKRGVFIVLSLAIPILLSFPNDVDQPLNRTELEKTRKYYAEAYKPGAAVPAAAPSDFESRYLQIAERAAKTLDIPGQVRRFVEKYALRDKRVLDVGSGRGYLQDLVDDYTGLDISSNVGRFYHKKFVLGSATAMPFEDDTFDGAWSIWVQEHVPNPEQYLREIRRVVKNNGVIFLRTAWLCSPWAAQGYQVRPYSDFGIFGKLIKAGIPVRALAGVATLVPIRTVRKISSSLGPTRLHYQRLTPNYDVYWQADSDAVNSIDAYEVMLWFTTRGDECLNCNPPEGSVFMRSDPLVIRVHK